MKGKRGQKNTKGIKKDRKTKFHSDEMFDDIIDRLIRDDLKGFEINGNYLRAESTLILYEIYDDLNEEITDTKIIVNKLASPKIKDETIDVIINGIKYIGFVSKKKLESVPYFQNGIFSGKFNDVAAEINIESDLISSITLLMFIETSSISRELMSIIEKDKNSEKLFFKIIELLQFLSIDINYKGFNEIMKGFSGKEIFVSPPSIRDTLFKIKIDNLANTMDEKKRKDLTATLCIHACKQILIDDSGARFMKMITDRFPTDEFHIEFDLKKKII